MRAHDRVVVTCVNISWCAGCSSRGVPHTQPPRDFALENISLLRRVWNGVRDGEVESLHQARVATRRLRAVLDVLRASPDEIDLCRSLGRAFGRVRDLDVAHELAVDLGVRMPAAAAAVGVIQRDLYERRDRARRRLIKALDRIELRPLAHRRARRPLAPLVFWTDWREGLIAAVIAKTTALRAAIDNAPLVYMPNRLHRVRIALKKLRYVLEIAEAAGTAIDRDVMRDARKIQDTLGRMHDVHTARELVRRLDVRARRIADEARLVDAVMTADCAALHAKYLSRRERLPMICDYSAALVISRPAARAGRMVLRALPAAGIAALPIAMWRLSAGGPAETATA